MPEVPPATPLPQTLSAEPWTRPNPTPAGVVVGIWALPPKPKVGLLALPANVRELQPGFVEAQRDPRLKVVCPIVFSVSLRYSRLE